MSRDVLHPSSSRPAQVEQWALDAQSTRYRVIVVSLTSPFHDPQDMYPPDTYVMVEPAAGRRVWFPVSSDTVLAQSYVEEKAHCHGADARALTTLLAAALDRKPLLAEEGP